jgi:hypothetical protein
MIDNNDTTAAADHLVRASRVLEWRTTADAITAGVHARDVRAFWEWCMANHGASFKEAVLAIARSDNPRRLKALATLYLAR